MENKKCERWERNKFGVLNIEPDYVELTVEEARDEVWEKCLDEIMKAGMRHYVANAPKVEGLFECMNECIANADAKQQNI